MNNRDVELESKIRDSQLYKIEFQYDHYSDLLNVKKYIKLTFIDDGKEYIELTLINPFGVSLFDDTYIGEYVEQIKCLVSKDKISICLDPYDERIETITEKDNFVFHAESYSLRINKISTSKVAE